MIDLLRRISSLRRPRLLIRAARLGVAEYRRERDLCRLMRRADLPCPSEAITSLLDEEDLLEDVRRSGGADYSAMRHVEVLIALMAEARLLPRPVGEIR